MGVAEVGVSGRPTEIFVVKVDIGVANPEDARGVKAPFTFPSRGWVSPNRPKEPARFVRATEGCSDVVGVPLLEDFVSDCGAWM